jgi:hypothetical protein
MYVSSPFITRTLHVLSRRNVVGDFVPRNSPSCSFNVRLSNSGTRTLRVLSRRNEFEDLILDDTWLLARIRRTHGLSSRVSAWKFVMFATRHRLARGFEDMSALRSTLFGGED